MKKVVEKRTMFGNIPTESAKQYNARVQFEINRGKVEIDKDTFVKTDEEKDILRRRKLRYRESVVDGSHTAGTNAILKQMESEKSPRWGSCKIGILVS